MAMKRQTAASYVPAIHHARPAPLTDIPAPNVIDIVRQGHASAQNLQEDTALVAAQATLLVSLAYLAAIGLIVTGIAVLAWIFQAMGERIAVYAFTGLVGFGLAALASLLWNRRQSLYWESAVWPLHLPCSPRCRISFPEFIFCWIGLWRWASLSAWKVVKKGGLKISDGGAREFV